MMQKWVRRFLAKKEAERRQKAVQVLRNFIKGFITRNGEATEENKAFIELAKAQWLNRLAKSLPKGVMSTFWPPCPVSCKEASEHLRKMYKLHVARQYRLALTPERKKQFDMKVLAEGLFRGKH